MSLSYGKKETYVWVQGENEKDSSQRNIFLNSEFESFLLTILKISFKFDLETNLPLIATWIVVM